MSLHTLTPSDRRFFATTYRLAQQSVEGFAFWRELLPHLKLRRLKYWDGVVANEDLLRLIITNTKRSFVITSYILSDNEGPGRTGYNVFQLVERCGKLDPDFDADAERRLLMKPDVVGAIKKIRLLRNNLDAHHVANDGWKKTFGRFTNAEFERLISTLYGIVLRCNRRVGMRRLSENSLIKTNVVYADRLLRALTKQKMDGEIGPQFTSVDDWESEAHDHAID
jgi:hypothetical protein